MAKLRASNIEPSTGTTLALGASADSILISSDSIKNNTWQDLGGNSLFVSDGSGTLSSVNSSLTGGGYTLISAQTADNNSAIGFTGGIDNTYKEYMIVCTDINPATNSADFGFQVDVAAGSSYNINVTSSFFRAYNREDNGGQGLDYESGGAQSNGTGLQILARGLGNGADEGCAGILQWFNPSSTTYVKHFYATFSCNRSDATAQGLYAAGYFNTTSALTKIRFAMSSGNFDGTMQLYGVG